VLQEIQYPVSRADLILRACNSQEPLQPGDSRWYDFAPLRHAWVLDRLERVFQGQLSSGKFHHRLLCGHRGSGKSTELLRFKEWALEHGFACEHIEVDVRLGHVQLEFSDFYLLAAMATEAAMVALGSPLPSDSVEPIIKWFAEITDESSSHRESEMAVEAEAQLGGRLPLGLGRLVAKFSSATKAGASHATTARQQMRQYPDRLIDLTNALLEDATRRLRQLRRPHTGGLVLLFDNLDRYNPDAINQVLISGSNLLRRLGCHALFTIPVDLEYNPRSGPLRDAYGQPVVLPMIPLRQSGDSWKKSVASSRHGQEAVAGLREALAKRVAIEDVFDRSKDAEVLVKMSGGCIRDLMHLMTLSYEMSEGEKLSARGVQRAVAELRATHARELAQADYDRLADIAARRAVPRDELTLRLLYNLGLWNIMTRMEASGSTSTH
jgi:hypothetical protein